MFDDTDEMVINKNIGDDELDILINEIIIKRQNKITNINSTINTLVSILIFKIYFI